MADQVTTIALDDKGYASGLNRVERANKLVADRIDAAWQRTGKSMDAKWAVSMNSAMKVTGKAAAGIAAAFAVATRALSAYKDAFPGAVQEAGDLTKVMQGLWVELGRNYEASGVGQWFKSAPGMINAVLDSASELANFLSAGMLGDGPGGMAEARAAQVQIEMELARKKLMEETLDLQIAQAEAEGRLGDAAAMRQRKQLEADQAKINGLAGGLAANDPAVLAARAAAASAGRGRQAAIDTQVQDDTDELAADAAEASGDTLGAKNIREGLRLRKQMRGFDAMEGRGADVSGLRAAAQANSQANRARIASEEDSPSARAFKAARAQDIARAGQSAELQQAAELRRIEMLSLEGHEKEAALAKVRLEYARQRADIESQDLVTQEEKARLLDELGVQEGRALELTGAGFDRGKGGPRGVLGLEAGLGSAAAQVFGVGGNRDPSREQVTEIKKTNRILEEIKRNTARSGEAQYGE